MTVTIVSTTISHAVVLGEGNYGTNLTITNTGKINAVTIGVASNVAFTNVLNSGSIHSQDVAVQLGDGIINNTGHIYGTTIGVQLNDGSTMTNSGTIAGGAGYAVGMNAYSTLDNTGDITAKNAGVVLRSGTMSNGGTISGGTVGAYLVQGIIYNSASIYGKTIGVDVFSTAAATGALQPPGGDVTNSASGTIRSADVGVAIRAVAAAPSTFANAGSIIGGISGVLLENASLINSGVISGGTAGVALYSGNVANTGTITGPTYGIYIETGTVTNAGTISGTGFAIYGLDSFTLNIDPGAVFNGKVEDHAGNGLLNLAGTAAGSIAGIGTSFTGFSSISFGAGASWTVEGDAAGLAAGQAISGFTLGDTIILDGFAATSEVLTTAGLVLNDGSGTETLGLTGVALPENYDVATSGGNTAVEFVTIGALITTVSLNLLHDIELGSRYFASNLVITKTGTVGNVTAALSAVLTNYGQTGNVNFNNGQNPNDVDELDNFGLVAGLNGVDGAPESTVFNSGTIEALTPGGYGVGLIVGGNLTNSGYIFGASTAVSASDSDITNTESISGAVFLQESTLTNSGQISSTNVAVNEFDDGIDNSIVENSGTIIGQADGIMSSGINLVNAGLISGGSFAIYNHVVYGPANSDSGLNLTVDPGARFTGAVRDTTGLAALTLAGSTAGSLDIGTTFTGFRTIDFASGSSWTLEGAANGLADGQSISGFLEGESIVVDSFAATAASFIAGTGLILSSAIGTETLDMVGNFSTDDFAVTTENGNTDIAALARTLSPISTISTVFHTHITLGVGNYTNNLSITNTGAIIPPPYIVSIIAFGGNTIANAGSVGGIIVYGAASITNSGTLDSDFGIRISSGQIENSGLITDTKYSTPAARSVYFGEGSLINTGTITGARIGVELSGGNIFNSGVITGSDDAIIVSLDIGMTNAGTISGNILASSAFHLTVDPGAVFEGSVNAALYPGVSSVLALAGTTAGSLDIGNSFSGFSDINFANGATWALEGSASDLANGETINGFRLGDNIMLDGFSATSESYVSGSGLTLSDGTSIEILDINGSFSTTDFHVSSAAGVTDIQIACFAAGTRILTPYGDVAVERLAVGDMVITGDDDDRPITWIGKRRLDLTRHAAPANAQPVRIAAGSFAEGLPCRDLLLSPDHAIHIEGMLVPAKALINGKNICQLNRATVTYYHIELAVHGIIFAEHLGVETYLDSGNRGAFENGGAALTLHPDFAQSLREAHSCAPFVETGPAVEAARLRTLQRYYAMSAARSA